MSPGQASNNSVIIAGIFTVVGAIFGGAVTEFLNGQSVLALEEKKFSSSLVLQALENNDTEEAMKRLRLLIRLGFLDHEEGRIAGLAEAPELAPARPETIRQPTLWTANADLDAYCASKYGGASAPGPGSPLTCSSGAAVHEVDIRDLCLWAHGTEVYSLDQGTLTIRCLE